MDIKGSTAFVTGGGRGIGRDICLELATHGVTIVAADIDDDREEIVDLVEAEGHTATEVFLDLRDPETVSAAIDRAREEAGGIDILVNNAGIGGPTKPVEEVSLDEWETTMSVNLRGAFLCARAVVGGMKERGYGRIINISSASGKRAVPDRSPYTSSKAGLLGLTRTLAAEGGSHGITANAICPGSVSGPRIERVIESKADETDRTPADVREEKLDRMLVDEFVDAANVASLVAYLCSDAARSTTGQAINVTGGKIID
jgi:NAD(P)-dependent dehydrogenase (short-subunit alcohol dehydrogenase family)